MVEKFNLGGEDLSRMLKNQKAGKIDSWAIIWTYSHFKILPRVFIRSNQE